MVLSCIDPRFQPIIYKYLKKKKLIGKYSSFTIAGSAVGVTANKFKKWHKTFWDNFDTSVRLHKIKKLVHNDCLFAPWFRAGVCKCWRTCRAIYPLNQPVSSIQASMHPLCMHPRIHSCID